MKGPSRKEDSPSGSAKTYESKVGKLKQRMSSQMQQQVAPVTYDEAKATCKARKRKERQESISSLYQERKVIRLNKVYYRSNSEERPTQKKLVESKSNIRRVSSSEDFQRPGATDRASLSPHRGGSSEKTLTYDDCEHEKRRSHERFARPLTLKSKKHPHKRLRVRYLSRTKCKPELPTDTKDHHKKSNTLQCASDKTTDFLDAHSNDGQRDRSPSPTHRSVSPVLDLSTLHEQVDSNEPMLSQSRQVTETTETMPSLSVATNRLLSSPRNSIIATHRIYLDPDIPKMISSLDQKLQSPVDEKCQKLAKQINSVKKKIKKYEGEFENKHGFKPSYVEKMSDKNMKKLYSELSKLKKEQKQLTEMSSTCTLIPGEETKSEKMSCLETTVSEIEKKLTTKRETAGRSYRIEEMTPEQLMDEKVAIQKALLYLEATHGRPNTKENRDIVRPFYDRYRTLKRLVVKISTPNSSGNELATIHENEAMNFITPTSSSQSNDTESEKTATMLPSISTDSDTDSSIGENLHSLPRSELLQQLKVVTEEKKELRRTIKQFEMEMQMKTGRMIQKEDKVSMETVYLTYKKTKAKYRLLEALVGKASS
ncbi:unnamed protein product [Acanthoscelides obtectus]|uniref:FAM13A-like domain-containing protein n=1 Tax=Acanthoscelides obtectus TaxID=200917 RepID=A0A9P0LB44_ACAOB|nr:unnamed protein product [Acanthoscelides obtectus]CAK1637978.1 Protein FAM13A [Acanthoscelides obtectus]